MAAYADNLTKENGFSWYVSGQDGAPWEAKIFTFIDLISRIDKKISVIISALKAAPVPWSKGIYLQPLKFSNLIHYFCDAGMKNLCQIGEAMNHADVKSIEEQKQLVVIKEICLKYKAGKTCER